MSDGYIPFDQRIGGAEFEAGQPVVASFLSPGSHSGTGASDNGDGSGSVGRDANGTEFDPEQHIGRDKLNADGSFRRKRGRKSNSAAGGNRSKANNQASIDSLTRMLAVVHVGIAGVLHAPEMMLEDNESAALAGSIANVLEQFDIRPDPRIEAVIGLCVVSGSIYGPRIYNIRERRKQERADKNDG